MFTITQISKEESILIRKKFPDVHITIINRQKKAKRKKYRMEDCFRAIKYLEEIRNGQITKQ